MYASPVTSDISLGQPVMYRLKTDPAPRGPERGLFATRGATRLADLPPPTERREPLAPPLRSELSGLPGLPGDAGMSVGQLHGSGAAGLPASHAHGAGAPLHASPFDLPPPAAVPPAVPAHLYLNGAHMRNDPSWTGIRMDSAPQRVHKRTHEFMLQQNKVRVAQEICPYTGRKIDYYEDLPPEGNTDRQLTTEDLENTNRRLIMLQGYDPNAPKRFRREVLQSTMAPPAPDGKGVLSDQARNQSRVMREIQERVSRDLRMNQNGNAPKQYRETARPFGFVGFQDMNRFIPYMPPTMREGALERRGTAYRDGIGNPLLEASLTRQHHRDDARRSHEAATPLNRAHAAAPTLGHAVVHGVHEHAPTMRAQHEHDRRAPGNEFADVGAGRAGRVDGYRTESRRTTHLADLANVQYGRFAAEGAADNKAVFGAHAHADLHQHNRTTRRMEGALGAVPAGLGLHDAGPAAAANVPQLTASLGRVAGGQLGAVPAGLAASGGEYAAHAAVPQLTTGLGRRTEGMQGAAHQGFAVAQPLFEAGAWGSRATPEASRRVGETVGTAYYTLGAAAETGGLTVQGGVHGQKAREFSEIDRRPYHGAAHVDAGGLTVQSGVHAHEGHRLGVTERTGLQGHAVLEVGAFQQGHHELRGGQRAFTGATGVGTAHMSGMHAGPQPDVGGRPSLRVETFQGRGGSDRTVERDMGSLAGRAMML